MFWLDHKQQVKTCLLRFQQSSAAFAHQARTVDATVGNTAGANQHAVPGSTGEVTAATYGAIILALRASELQTQPKTWSEVCCAQVTNESHLIGTAEQDLHADMETNLSVADGRGAGPRHSHRRTDANAEGAPVSTFRVGATSFLCEMNWESTEENVAKTLWDVCRDQIHDREFERQIFNACLCVIPIIKHWPKKTSLLTNTPVSYQYWFCRYCRGLGWSWKAWGGQYVRAVWKKEAHLVTALLLLVSFGVAMADDVLKLRRIVPAWQLGESSTPIQFEYKVTFKVMKEELSPLTGWLRREDESSERQSRDPWILS